MIELILIFYLIPKQLYPLAKNQGRSGLAWSAIGGLAFLGGEFAAALLLGILYAVFAAIMGLPFEPKGVFLLVSYVGAIVGGFLCLHVVRRRLEKPDSKPYIPPPPDPPNFS